jgi:hypothetical protein
LNGASGETLKIDLPDPDYEGVSFSKSLAYFESVNTAVPKYSNYASPTDSGFSVTSISGTDEYFQVSVYGSEGSVTVVSDDDTVAVGPPQPQISAFCDIVCPE